MTIRVAWVGKNATCDWTIKIKCKRPLKVIVKRILCQYRHPPDEQALSMKNERNSASGHYRL